MLFVFVDCRDLSSGIYSGRSGVRLRRSRLPLKNLALYQMHKITSVVSDSAVLPSSATSSGYTSFMESCTCRTCVIVGLSLTLSRSDDFELLLVVDVAGPRKSLFSHTPSNFFPVACSVITPIPHIFPSR